MIAYKDELHTIEDTTFKGGLTANYKIWNPSDRLTPGPKIKQDVIWDNGEPTDFAHSSQLDECYPFDSQVADDFMFDVEMAVCDVHWYGDFWNGPPDEVDPVAFWIYIYIDDGTGNKPTTPVPGSAVASYYYPTLTGYPLYNGYYSYHVDLDPCFIATAGQKYWIAIQAAFCFPPQWGWVSTTGITLEDSCQGFPLLGTPYWMEQETDMAFYLTGCEPVPVGFEKLVYDPQHQAWVDYANIQICTITQFYIGLHNNGEGPISVEYIFDSLPPCVEYMNNAWISYPNSGGWIPFEPVFTPPFDLWWQGPWTLQPCECIEIMFDVHVIGPECILNENWAWTEGMFEYDTYEPFYAEDFATIYPVPEGYCQLDLFKYSWCEPQQAWVKEVNASFCQNIKFRIEIHNTGYGVPAEDIYVYDYMESSLEYVTGSSTVNGVPYEPDFIWIDPLTGETYIDWYLGATLLPTEWLIIEFEAHVIGDAGDIDYNCAIADFYCLIHQQYEYSNEDSASVHIVKCLVCADANGPYTTDHTQGFQITLNGSGSFPGSGCHALSYLWEIPTVGTFTGINPIVTFNDPCPEHLYVTYQVTLVVTCVLNPLCTDTDTTTITVYGECAGDPPIVQWIYPTGGETLSGTVDLQWFALDDHDPNLDIYLFADMVKIAGPIANTGSYSWSTNSVSDGTYSLKVEAINDLNILNFDSATITVDNGYANVKVAMVLITDTSIGSTHYVKNGDTVEITADITGGQHLTREKIIADLNGFGKGTNFFADAYNGYIARWLLTNIECNPSDGDIIVTVTADNIHSNSATITADNTAPELSILKPENRLYFFNIKLFPLARPIIFGPITIETSVNDVSGISKVEFYTDDELKTTSTEKPYKWYMNRRLLGKHTFEIVVYDNVGNENSDSKDIIIFRFFGPK